VTPSTILKHCVGFRVELGWTTQAGPPLNPPLRPRLAGNGELVQPFLVRCHKRPTRIRVPSAFESFYFSVLRVFAFAEDGTSKITRLVTHNFFRAGLIRPGCSLSCIICTKIFKNDFYNLALRRSGRRHTESHGLVRLQK
jgi:hypothetical protein